MDIKRKKKTPWSNLLGQGVRLGDPQEAVFLEQAFSVPGFSFHSSPTSMNAAKEKLGMHLFHSYQARTNPLVIRKLLSRAKKGDVVLDPFVGSGTTLVEAFILGQHGVGCDLSELAVRLTRVKTTLLNEEKIALLLQAGQELFDISMEAVQKKVKPKYRYDDASYYEPHVYMELCNLRYQIELLRERSSNRWLTEHLLLVFSAILNKATLETSSVESQDKKRTLSKGRVSSWFLARVQELAVLSGWLRKKVTKGYIVPEVFVHDAKELLPFKKAAPFIDMIVTSPPYLGVYDYAFLQERRHAFLGISAEHFLREEIGAKRFLTSSTERAQLLQHQQDTDRWIASATQHLKPGGRMYVIVGDSILGQIYPGEMPIIQAAKQVGLEFVACYSVDKIDRNQKKSSPQIKEHLLSFIKPLSSR